MAIPFKQAARIGAYLMKQHLLGRKHYPLVLMLEPLFRCNLACAGCGKIDYPDEVLNARLSVQECLDAANECGAPCVTIAGGEPLLHREIEKVVEGLLDQGRIVILCTNALLLERNLARFKPHPNFNFSVHLDGGREDHDSAVCQEGTYDIATKAMEAAKAAGFRVSINCTLFDTADPERVAEHFDKVMAMGAEGFTVSPGYAYERAPNTEHFLNRRKTKELFRSIFKLGKQNGRKWSFTQSSLFLDFLAGNQTYRCTPWAMPCRNVFGWQRPCYLLGEGYTKTYTELMATTDWDLYGVGNYEKCANCMVHCGFEGTAVKDMIQHPWKMLPLAVGGINTEGPMAPEIPLDNQRPAEAVYEAVVGEQVSQMAAENRLPQKRQVTT